jgi:6-pyruvoyltetrahydropterin/6-carboxytetrahydropterin synthase
MSDVFTITKSFSFSASHQLDALPTGHKCTRLHGHNYTAKVFLTSRDLDEYGFVADYARLDPIERFLKSKWDHRHLNDVLETPPTCEHLARALYDWCSSNLEPELAVLVSSVRISETPSTWAEYEGPQR